MSTTTATTPLSARAQAALAHLLAGAYFSERLETDKWTRRSQFHTRLRDAKGAVIPGYGYATRLELEKARLLRPADCWRFSDHESRMKHKDTPKSPDEIAAELEHEVNRNYL